MVIVQQVGLRTPERHIFMGYANISIGTVKAGWCIPRIHKPLTGCHCFVLLSGSVFLPEFATDRLKMTS